MVLEMAMTNNTNRTLLKSISTHWNHRCLALKSQLPPKCQSCPHEHQILKFKTSSKIQSNNRFWVGTPRLEQLKSPKSRAKAQQLHRLRTRKWMDRMPKESATRLFSRATKSTCLKPRLKNLTHLANSAQNLPEQLEHSTMAQILWTLKAWRLTSKRKSIRKAMTRVWGLMEWTHRWLILQSSITRMQLAYKASWRSKTSRASR